MKTFVGYHVTELNDGSYAAFRESMPYFFITAKSVEELHTKAALKLAEYEKENNPFSNVELLDRKKTG